MINSNLKIRIIVLFTFLLVAVSVSAQNFRLGFQASPQFSWMSSTKNDISNKDLRPGVKYGLEADIYLAGFPRYSLNTGLFIANQSISATFDISETFFINEAAFTQPVDVLFKMNYIEIPLNIKLKSDQFYRMTFYGQFGLSNMINFSASASSSDAQLTGENVNNGFANRVVRPYYLSMIMGGGVQYDIGGNTSFNLGIQYSNGLTDVTDFKNLEEKTIVNSMRLVLGVMF